MSTTEGLRRAGSVSGTLLPEIVKEDHSHMSSIRFDTAPRSLPPILRVGSGSNLAPTQKMSVSSTNLSKQSLSASGSNLSCGTESQHHLRIKGMLGPPQLFRSRSRGDNSTSKGENGDQEGHRHNQSSTRTRLLFWPHAGPASTNRRGSMMEYDVMSRRSSFASTVDSMHDLSLDSISVSDLIRGKNNSHIQQKESS